MKLMTSNFGEIEVDQNQVITFEDGLPGFENLKQFTIIYDEENGLFSFMQSLEEDNICFTLINSLDIIKNYSFEVDDQLIAGLGPMGDKGLALYSIVVIPDNFENITANLLAPIIINMDTMKGMQVILNEENYQVKHPIYDYLLTYLKKDGESYVGVK